MKFQPERLIQLRNTLNINKAEAARRLNISPMVYGRYENGQREPSYPTVGFIVQTFKGIQSFLGSLLFRVFRSGSSVGSFSRVWF